jgi:hypothetical protein
VLACRAESYLSAPVHMIVVVEDGELIPHSVHIVREGQAFGTVSQEHMGVEILYTAGVSVIYVVPHRATPIRICHKTPIIIK